jgi:hypothetical protein
MGSLKEGKREAIGVDPSEITSLNVSTHISNTSSAERITLVEHGRALLNDPKVPLTVVKFIEEYMGLPNPDEVKAQYDAEQIFDQFMKPGLIAQELRRAFGTRIVLGADGAMLGPDGQPMAPEDVFAANGLAPPVPPPPPVGAGTGVVTGAGQQMMIPDLGPIQPPGAIPLNGMIG